MKHPSHRCCRLGVTLVEVMTTLAIAASLMTASMVVLRSNYGVWTHHEASLDRAGAANAVLRHVVRGVRQAADVTAITPSTSASGSISLLRDDGSTETWTHAAGSVTYRLDTGAEQTLADTISSMVFEGYEADGTTLTTTAADVHVVRCVVTTNLPDEGDRTVSSYAWVRAW